jgi:hypothetical protein
MLAPTPRQDGRRGVEDNSHGSLPPPELEMVAALLRSEADVGHPSKSADSFDGSTCGTCRGHGGQGDQRQGDRGVQQKEKHVDIAKHPTPNPAEVSINT